MRDLRSTVGVLEAAIERTGANVVVIGGLVNPHGAFAARRRGAALVWQIVDSRTPAPIRRPAMSLVRRYADAVLFDGETLVVDWGLAKVVGREETPARQDERPLEPCLLNTSDTAGQRPSVDLRGRRAP